MALAQNKYSFSYNPVVGDLSYSMANRILQEIANFLINNGFSLAHKYSAPNQYDSDRYTFNAAGNVYVHISFTSSTLYIISGFGPISSSGYPTYSPSNRQFNINSSGVIELEVISSNNCKILCINKLTYSSFFLFNKGWGVSQYPTNTFVLELNGLFYYCSTLSVENSFYMTDINDKHLLLNPIFTFSKVPKYANNYKIDDSIIYMGECYAYPESMGNLQGNIFYIASDGTKYFNGGFLSRILIVD